MKALETVRLHNFEETIWRLLFYTPGKTNHSRLSLCRFVGANERALENEQRQRRARREKYIIPRLHAKEKNEKQEGHAKRHSLKLPKLEKCKERKNGGNRVSDADQRLFEG